MATERASEDSTEAATESTTSSATRVTLPAFDPNDSAFAYQRLLVRAGFSYVRWRVGPGGPDPTQSLTTYDIHQTLPVAGTGLDPTELVQVIIFLPT